jgi:large subunit ribosomal protein L25
MCACARLVRSQPGARRRGLLRANALRHLSSHPPTPSRHSTLDGKRERVLPRDFQVHPFRPKAIAINWLRYRAGAYPGVKLDIPLKAFNEERCPGIKEGGWLLELVHKLPVYASGEAIPDYLMIDLRGLKIGDKIMASHVELNDGLMLVSARAAVCSCCCPRCFVARAAAAAHLFPPARTTPTQRSRVRDFAIARIMGSRRNQSGEADAVAADKPADKAPAAKAAA